MKEEKAGNTGGGSVPAGPSSSSGKSARPVKAPKAARVDKELEEFRSLMEVPATFEDGFNWTSLFGALFIAILMVPGSMYMGLLAGGGMGGAAQWVTVILFIEVARRAQKDLSKSEVFVLFYMAGAAMGAPFSGMLWHQFFINSQAALSQGISEQIPIWYAPPLESASYAARSFLNWDWLPVIGFTVFQTFFGQLSTMVLGYGLFRLSSDIEKLPFPMAPIGAQGIIALAEDSGKARVQGEDTSWRWRVFSIGGALGLLFGAVYLLLPTVSTMTGGRALQILPIPFSDWSDRTQGILPAVATGMSWDLGNLLVGMVLPYWAMVGSFIGLVVTFVINPVLYNMQILSSWKPDDTTVTILFKNNVDFYFSFGIGVSLAIAMAGFVSVFKSLRGYKETLSRQKDLGKVSTVPPGRGDLHPWFIIATYFLVTITTTLLAGWMIDWHPTVMLVLVFFGFVYTPVISYVTARMEGIAGQVVEIPMIREAALILSGYQGVKIWFLPIPMNNYGDDTVFYRKCELTGTSFWSIWKTKLVLFPIILVSSILFANFIWSLAPIPSSVYPFTQVMWELQALNSSIIMTSTMGEYSLFEDAFKWNYLWWGAGAGSVLFGAMTWFGAPIFLVYGVVRGLGQSMPHSIIPQLIGALLGQFYFKRKWGLKWRQFVPVLVAGFSCGMGLVATLGIGLTFLSKAVIKVPF